MHRTRCDRISTFGALNLDGDRQAKANRLHVCFVCSTMLCRRRNIATPKHRQMGGVEGRRVEVRRGEARRRGGKEGRRGGEEERRREGRKWRVGGGEVSLSICQTVSHVRSWLKRTHRTSTQRSCQVAACTPAGSHAGAREQVPYNIDPGHLKLRAKRCALRAPRAPLQLHL